MPSITLKAIAAAGCFFALVSISSQFHTEKLEAVSSIEENLVDLSLALEQDSVVIKNRESAKNVLEKADLLESRGQVGRANSLYKKIIERNLSTELTWEAHHRRAQNFLSQENLKEAKYEYSSFISRANPGILRSLAYSYRAEVYEKLGDHGQAELDREKISKLH